ncbi:putative GTP-binding protein GEM [Hypsibius exemplaris]|uniref:GTP-binding protein GEM n=1 Tax=Hypsibius exemplaris TaxID=2072580 RepID=A0A9X6NP01_HYPEX|nr:putative GTP-binding protein GEM [Hypsibius exemplaris]
MRQRMHEGAAGIAAGRGHWLLVLPPPPRRNLGHHHHQTVRPFFVHSKVMAQLKERERQHLSAIFDAHVRHSSSSSSRSGASSRDSSETRGGGGTAGLHIFGHGRSGLSEYPSQTLRKQSSPAYLSADYRSHFSTPSPGRSSNCGGGLHSRSQSVKYPSGHRRPSPHQRAPSSSLRQHLALELDVFRPREGSTAAEDDQGNTYRLRNFDVKKGVVRNRGDSYRTKSNSSLSTPMGSYHSEVAAALSRNERLSVSSAYSTGADTSLSGETATSMTNPKYKVLMSGAPGVGKTALTNQFLTSEYMNAYDSLLNDDDSMEKSVSVLLDGQESDMDFLDPESSTNLYDDKVWEASAVDAHVIVYSVADRTSFEKAVDILFELKQSDITKHHAIILVGNKSDLVRARIVATEEGKSTASSYDCKFTETSAGLNINVDELLVGILTQIRLKEKCAQKKSKNKRALKYKGRQKEKRSLTSGYEKAFGMLSRLLSKNSLSKSCGNLHVL